MPVIVWLGILQGAAEFLPVSSSGHLVVVQSLLGMKAPGAGIEVALHLGTLGAVAAAMQKDLRALVGGVARREAQSLRLLVVLAVASLPAAAAGAALSGVVAALFQPALAMMGFLITGAVLWTTPAPGTGTRPLERVGLRDAMVVGTAQACALLPGLSRSGSTMAAARWCGLDPDAAARLSFLMAVPVTLGASLLELPRSGVPASAWPGVAAAFAAGLVAIPLARHAVATPRHWKGFSVYTWLMAVVAALA